MNLMNGYTLLFFVIFFTFFKNQEKSDVSLNVYLEIKGSLPSGSTLLYNEELESVAQIVLSESEKCSFDLTESEFVEAANFIRIKAGFYGYVITGIFSPSRDGLKEAVLNFFSNMPISSNFNEIGIFHNKDVGYLAVIGRKKAFLSPVDLKDEVSGGDGVYFWGKLSSGYGNPEIFILTSNGKILTINPEVSDKLFYHTIPISLLKGGKLEITAESEYGKEVIDLIDFSFQTKDLCEYIRSLRELKKTGLALKNLSPEVYLFRLINNERKKAGLHPLTLDSSLSKIAEMHSFDMAINRYFGHYSKKYGSLFHRLKKGGIQFEKGFENIAISDSILKAHHYLCTTPSHYSVILNKKIKRVGIGIVISNGTYFITEDFVY